MKTLMTIISWLLKAFGFLMCMSGGMAITEWEIAGQPETGWIVWRPFVLFGISIFSFYVSRKVKER